MVAGSKFLWSVIPRRDTVTELMTSTDILRQAAEQQDRIEEGLHLAEDLDTTQEKRAGTETRFGNRALETVFIAAAAAVSWSSSLIV